MKWSLQDDCTLVELKLQGVRNYLIERVLGVPEPYVRRRWLVLRLRNPFLMVLLMFLNDELMSYRKRVVFLQRRYYGIQYIANDTGLTWLEVLSLMVMSRKDILG